MIDSRLKEIETLITHKTDVLWVIAIRKAAHLNKMEMEDAVCPSCLNRRILTYYSLNDEQLNEELIDLCETIDQLLEAFNPETLKEILP